VWEIIEVARDNQVRCRDGHLLEIDHAWWNRPPATTGSNRAEIDDWLARVRDSTSEERVRAAQDALSLRLLLDEHLS